MVRGKLELFCLLVLFLSIGIDFFSYIVAPNDAPIFLKLVSVLVVTLIIIDIVYLLIRKQKIRLQKIFFLFVFSNFFFWFLFY